MHYLQKVSRMHEFQHVLDRKVEKGTHRMSRNKNHRDKRCWKAVSTWIKLVSRKLGFSM